jgi:hypothetical protein
VGGVDLQKGNRAEGLDFYRRVALLICGQGSYSITPPPLFLSWEDKAKGLRRRGIASAV